MSKKTPGVFKASGKKSPQNKNSKKSQVPQSRFRRLMRGPLFWIIVAIAADSEASARALLGQQRVVRLESAHALLLNGQIVQ